MRSASSALTDTRHRRVPSHPSGRHSRKNSESSISSDRRVPSGRHSRKNSESSISSDRRVSSSRHSRKTSESSLSSLLSGNFNLSDSGALPIADVDRSFSSVIKQKHVAPNTEPKPEKH